MKLFQIRYRLLQFITIVYLSCIIPADAAALLALSSSETGFIARGTPHLILTSGGIHVNSCGIEPVDLFRGPIIEAEYVNIVGLNYNSSFHLDEGLIFNDVPAPLHVGVPELPDPYADLPEPLYSGFPDLGTISSAGTYNPGYYSGGIKLNYGAVTLNPGIYILGGNGLQIFNAALYAEDVFLFVASGEVYFERPQVILSPPDSGMYAGICIFQSHTNTNPAEITGYGMLDISGALYLPQSHLYLRGHNDHIGSQIIADSIEVGGFGEIYINYNGPNDFIPWNLNFSGPVDVYDLLIFSYEWLQTTHHDEPYFISDINADRNVDLNDFTILASHWMQCCGYFD